MAINLIDFRSSLTISTETQSQFLENLNIFFGNVKIKKYIC